MRRSSSQNFGGSGNMLCAGHAHWVGVGASTVSVSFTVGFGKTMGAVLGKYLSRKDWYENMPETLAKKGTAWSRWL